MLTFLLRRLALIPIMLIGISALTFAIAHLAPGDPASLRYGLNPEVSETSRAQLNRMWGLDQPMHVQFIQWLKRLARFDFGNSFIDDRPVRDKILERLPATLALNACALALIFGVAIPLGTAVALRRGSPFDTLVSIGVFIGYAMPTFWVALILMMTFGLKLGWFPISGFTEWYSEFLPPFQRVTDALWHLILPVAATAFGGLAGLSRYTRASMLEALRQDYVMAARAHGVPESRVVRRHVLRNALLPLITLVGLTLPDLVGGSILFETIFSWPGMGRLGYQAIMNHDLPVVMGVGVMSAFLTLAGILISDVLYAWADPRIRVRG